MLNFKQNLYLEEHSFAHAEKIPGNRSDIPRSEEISGIELRLANVLIRDNKTPAVFPFPGYAKLYFLCIVASSAGSGGYRFDLKSFENVDDGDALNIDKTLYYWKKEKPSDVAPAQIHVFTSLIKSKQPLRDVASVLSELYRDNSYKLLTATLDNLIKGATPLPDISNLIFNIAGIAGKYLGKVDDRPLLTWYQSFTDINGDFDPLGKTEKTAANRYASMTLALVVRDGMRMDKPAAEEKTKAGGSPLLFPFRQE